LSVLARDIHRALQDLRWSMIPRVKPEGMLFGKPVSILGSRPRAGFFRIMLQLFILHMSLSENRFPLFQYMR